jgi:hypothetical protein
MAARKAQASKKRSDRDFAKDLPEARKRNFENVGKRDPKEDPNSQQNIRAKREANAKRNAEAVRAREEQLAEAWAPGNHPDVAVAVKRTERAARQEQERIDAGKRAAEKSKGAESFKPPSQPGDKGFIAEPAHPEKPGPRGSAPRSEGTPDGPQGEDVIYVTDDIEPDGTPKVSQGFVEQTPEWDGESDRDYNDVAKRGGRRFEPHAAEPVDSPYLEERINQHSPEGALLDSIKEGREVRFVPNDAWLDPVSNNPDRRNADESA